MQYWFFLKPQHTIYLRISFFIPIIVARLRHMASDVWGNIGSGIGLWHV